MSETGSGPDLRSYNNDAGSGSPIDSSDSEDVIIEPVVDTDSLTPLDPTIQKAPGYIVNSRALSNTPILKHKIYLKVHLYHNGQKYDMTPDILQVKTNSDLNAGSGRFTLLLSFRRRWDLLVFPMDYIVIAFARYDASDPFVMRGFVSNIRRTRMADSTGKVQRAITINGENFGKIWNNYYIEYLVQNIGQKLPGTDVDPSTDRMLANMLTENYGIAKGDPTSGNITNADYAKGLLDAMLNPYIRVLKKVNPAIPALIPKINVKKDYALVNGPLIQSISNQTVYDVMNQFGNKPWCEYFIEDFLDGPMMIYRQTPYKDDQGKLIDPSSDPTTFMKKYHAHPRLTDIEVIEEDIGTSDNESFSYFFTYPAIQMMAQTDPRAMILGMLSPNIETQSNTVNIANPHVDLGNMYRFGFKSLMIGSNSIPFETSEITDTVLQLAQRMNEWLVKSFRWSHKMKNGTMKIKGDERMRIGRYVTQTSTQEQYYIESVDHVVTVAQVGSMGNDNVYRFESTIGVTRGRSMSSAEIATEAKAYGWK